MGIVNSLRATGEGYLVRFVYSGSSMAVYDTVCGIVAVDVRLQPRRDIQHGWLAGKLVCMI